MESYFFCVAQIFLNYCVSIGIPREVFQFFCYNGRDCKIRKDVVNVAYKFFT